MVLLIIGMILIDSISDIFFGYNFLYSAKFALVLIFAYVFTEIISFEQFQKDYIDSMTVISIIAIIGYIYGIGNSFFYPWSTVTNINGVHYYNKIIFFAMDDFSRGRNIGIFWEPGIFAIFIVLAMLFIIFDNSEKMQKGKFITLLIALLTTVSTTGYVLMMVVLISLLIVRFRNNKVIFFIGIAGIAIISILLMSNGGIENILMRFFPRVFSKLFDNTASVTTRTGSIVINLQNFLEYPWGVGLTKANYLFADKMVGSQTSTLTLYLVQFGILGIFFVLLQLRCIYRYRYWDKLKGILFVTVWIVLMNVEITTMFSLIYIIIFYFIKDSYSINFYCGENYVKKDNF